MVCVFISSPQLTLHNLIKFIITKLCFNLYLLFVIVKKGVETKSKNRLMLVGIVQVATKH